MDALVDTDKTLKEKARQGLCKNATGYAEQILEATPHETAAVQPLTSYLWNHPNKKCETLLKKQGWNLKWRCHSHGRASVGQPTKTYLQQVCADIGYSLKDLPGAMNDRDEWRERECVREICDSSKWWWYIHTQLKLVNSQLGKI